MRRALTALALLLGLPLSVAACLWDRDTPADEARGLPEVVAVLTGRFERNPPLFYEMRLERVTDHLQSHPEDLAAYDDAGVACDRLGRGDEAISWMEKKRAQLDGLDASRPEVKEQLYRYHANLGTFLVHRWVQARGRSDEDRRGEGGARRDRQGAGDQPERALRPREVPVAGAGVDHRPAEGRGGGRVFPISSVGASTTSTARRPIPRRPTTPCGGSPA